MSTPYIGEIKLFPYNFAPRGYAFCNGQILPISQNVALFSLLGTTYGGNGTSNFALPNLQSRVAIGQGQGVGLTPYVLGEVGGVESVALTTAELPPHSHPAQCVNAKANKPGAVGNVWAQDAAGVTAEYSSSAPNGTMAGNAIGQAGGGQNHPNIQPFLALSYCIALQGIFPSRN
jgi:microcystin-dependent protein